MLVREGADFIAEVIPSGDGRSKRLGFGEALLLRTCYKILKQ